jgi:Ca-activated chloride channel family protein
MKILAPDRLWLLLLVALLAVGYVVLQHRRRHYAVRFTNLALLDSVAPKRLGWRRHVAAAIAGVALVAMIVGLARPARDERVPREEAVVTLAIDVSRSMTATDVTPSRMESAITAARDFIAGVPDGFRIGLVAFDDEARILATPTLEHRVVLDALDRLQPGRGTAAGDAIDAALEAIATVLDPNDATETEQDFAATIVLLSDGATTSGVDPEDAAERAAEAGVPADPVAMEEIAEATDGTFFEAATASELRAVYDDIQGRVGFTVEQREIVLWFVTIGVIALMLALGASMLWTGRFV